MTPSGVWSVVEQILSVIFPPGEDALRVRACGMERFLQRVRIGEYYEGVRVLLDFRDPVVRAAIHEAKFHGNTKAVQLLSAVLQQHLMACDAAVLIPVPLSRPRLRERGWNQIELIAREALKGIEHVTLERKALRKVRHTPAQTALPKEARLTNVADAYGVRDPARVTDKNIILLDDVITTGATMEAARAELARHRPASVTCLALAH